MQAHPRYRELVEQGFAAASFVGDLGIRPLDCGPGWVEAGLDILPRHAQQNGYIHAGVQATLADHAAGAAAATIAGTVVAANLGTETQVAEPPPPTESSVASDPALTDPVIVATEWLRARVPGADLVAGTLQGSEDGNATVVFHEGEVQTQVFVRDEGEGWTVVAAASDMIVLTDVTFDGSNVDGRATPEAGGELTITWLVDGEDAGRHEIPAAAARQDVSVGLSLEQRGETATVRATLTVDGVTYLSEVTAANVVDPATPVGSYVSIWPATDSAGLAELQRQADAGERPDLLDPNEVAGRFLEEQGIIGFDTRAFQQGDSTSGEVPYGIEGGASGTILLRRTGGEGSVWYVTGATSDDLRIETTRREETHLVADVWSDTDGTLAWTGAPSVEVRSGQIVSIGKPDVPLGNHPVVVRLMDGERTLALAALLG